MNVDLSNYEMWLKYGIAAFLLIVIFRAFIFRTSFFGRALICFSAGLALFAVLMWYNFDDLIRVLEYDGTNERDKHLLSNHETTIRYYYWYSAAAALALGALINFLWLLKEKLKFRYIAPLQQARIFSLSIMFGCVVVLLIASLVLT
ncbi:MAG: hypothetical protein ABIX01_00030 [Chitinophagaceae bacterium]